MGWLHEHGHIKNLDKDPASLEMVMQTDHLSAYYRHLETGLTIRGSTYKPGTITLITRGFSVAIQGPMKSWLPEGTTRRRRTAALGKLLDHVRALSKSAASRRTVEGDPIVQVQDILPPRTAEELVAGQGFSQPTL
jgi:hypothetical protein